MKHIFKMVAMITLAIMFQAVFVVPTYAEEPCHYFSDHHKVAKDKGFTVNPKKDDIDEDDVHFGWNLGQLYVKGYTAKEEDKDGNPIFLKNSGDNVELGFDVMQDINKLNGDDSLSIAYDKKGYDKDYGIEKQAFGKGTLIVKHTNHKNESKPAKPYTNYLSAKSEVNADTTVKLKEEGDYEVVLDYTVKSNPRKVFGVSIIPKYYDYTIRTFKFSVRNGNSMDFLFDVASGNELKNKAFTRSGFRIDLAKSHYLKVNVSRKDDNGDVRENKPAKDGDTFTKEGLYTITVENPTTEQTTKKQIYVGDDEKKIAQVTTGKTMKEVEADLKNGGTVSEDGNIVFEDNEDGSLTDATSDEDKNISGPGVVGILVGALVVIACMILIRKRRRAHKAMKG